MQTRRLLLFLMTVLLALSSVSAQQSGTARRRSASKASTHQSSQVRGKKAAKGTAVKKQSGKTAAKKKGAATKKTQPSPTVASLQSQQKRLHQDTEAKKKRKAQVEQGVKNGMQTLLMLTQEIDHQRRVIDTIRHDIGTLDQGIALMGRQLDTLRQELDERKQHYMKSMRYLHRNRSVQNQLMFVFSADNFNQMYRRLRFTREYATFQKAQGEAVKQKQEQVSAKREELARAKSRMDSLLSRGRREQQQLEGKQGEQQRQVNELQKEQRTLAVVIEQQQRQEAELNASIEKLVAEEIARAKALAEAEARKKAAAEQARKRQEELARKRAAAEAARKESERRIAAAKAAEERAKSEARAAARKSAQERAAAERKAREAEQARQQAEQQAARDSQAREREIAEVKKSAEETYTVPSADRKLSGSFEQNRGRMPMPITGGYRLVRTFGSNVIEGLKNVHIESKGIYLKGQQGAQARSIFDGEVSAVFMNAGRYIVMIRHGKYISVYHGLSSVSVRKGQRISARQQLGTIGGDGIMQFQLRHWNQPLNPMRWLSR